MSGGKSGTKVEKVTLGDGTVAVLKNANKDKADRNMLYESLVEALGGRAAASTRLPGNKLLTEYIAGGHVEPVPFGLPESERKVAWAARRDRVMEIAKSPEARAIVLADRLTDNDDRHEGNWALLDGKPVALDNDRARFLAQGVDNYHNDLATYPSGGRKEFFAGPLAALPDALELVRPEFEAVGRSGWFDNLKKSAQRYAPVPDDPTPEEVPDAVPEAAEADVEGPGEGGDPLPDFPGPVVEEVDAPEAEAGATDIPEFVRGLIHPGDKVYSHPQGSWIIVSPNGAVAKIGPNGKPRKTSATAAKLAVGHGGWSPVEMTKSKPTKKPIEPPTAVKPMTDIEPAQAIVVSDVVEPELPSTPAPTGSKFSVPMAFDEAPVSEVPKYIEDPKYVFQQKVDGIRGQLVIEPGKAPWFRARSGNQLQNASGTKITSGIVSSMGTMPDDGPSYFVDGELLNGKWYVFDLVVDGNEKLSYSERQAILENWVKEMHKAGLKQIQALPTARTPDEKRALWETMNAQGGEGVLMKRLDAPYNPGSRVTHSLKAKITSTVDVVVMERNTKGHENAVIGVKVDGKLKQIGTVSMQGKEKGTPIKVGDVIEVEYLWAMPETHKLQQPRMVKRRPDKSAETVTDAQLRFVQKDIVDKEGWTATPDGPTPDSPDPVPETVEEASSPADEATSVTEDFDPVAGWVSKVQQDPEWYTFTGDPRDPGGMRVDRTKGDQPGGYVRKTDEGWSYVKDDGKTRPLTSMWPDLWRLLHEEEGGGMPASLEGVEPDKLWSLTDRQAAEGAAWLRLPHKPYPPVGYGGKPPPAKTYNAYARADSAWRVEFAARLKAGGPEVVPVSIIDPSSATDADLDAELARLSGMSQAAHVDAAKVQDAAMSKALDKWDQYISGVSDAKVARIAEAAAPLRAEMLRRLEGRVEQGTDPNYDEDRWSAAPNAPVSVLGPKAVDEAKRSQARNTYVVKDANTIEKNASLRSPNPTPAAKTWRGKTDAWIRSYVTTGDARTYRGIAVPPSVVESLRPGAVMSDAGVVSTDYSESNASFYLDTRIKIRPDAVPVMLEVLTPAGSHMVDADYGEWVLPSNTQMVVRKVVIGDDGTVRIVVEVVGGVTAAAAGGRGVPVRVGDGADGHTAALRSRVHGGLTGG